MKVEINLSELELLRNNNTKLEQQVKELTELYNSVDKTQLEKNISKHGINIFHSINEMVFEKLGFKYHRQYVNLEDVLYYTNGKYSFEKLVLEVDKNKIDPNVVFYLAEQWKEIAIKFGVNQEKI